MEIYTIITGMAILALVIIALVKELTKKKRIMGQICHMKTK
jgi:hypothetical protein